MQNSSKKTSRHTYLFELLGDALVLLAQLVDDLVLGALHSAALLLGLGEFLSQPGHVVLQLAYRRLVLLLHRLQA